MPRFTGWLRPVVDAAARVNSGVHRKLLFGFLIGALLLVAMGALSLVVIRQMNDRMVELNRAQLKATRGHEMLYAVTAQSHYRAMALLLPQDAARYNGQVEEAKTTFAELLDAMACAEPANAAFYAEVASVNREYEASGQRVLERFRQGDIAGATTLHLDEEHLTSHTLEASMRDLIATANEDMTRAQTDFQNSRTFFTSDGARVLRDERHRRAPAGIRALVGVHHSREEDAARAGGHHGRRLRRASGGAEPRRVREAGAGSERHERAIGHAVRRAAHPRHATR